jgi:hypothetical protein
MRDSPDFEGDRPGCERRSNSLAGGHGAGVIPYLHAAVIP